MSKKSEELLNSIKRETLTFLNYLRAKVPVFHNSNIFYRDIENSIRSFYEKKGSPVNNSQAEYLTGKLVEHLESQNILIKTSSQGWKVNYPDFVTVKPGDPL